MPVIGDREPDGYREAAVKAMLREAYVAPERAGQLACRPPHANGGRELADRTASHLEVLTWIRAPYLTHRQIRVIYLRFRDGLTLAETGRRLGWSEETVTRDQREAIQALIRIIWNDPTYVTTVWSEVKFRGGYGGDDGIAGRKRG